ncbi:MAG: DUF5808 domain-containing protein [Oscillospiraceae bacterium]|nr:DUF5808 domain-containing protein [Oscillospiraceae bacterium]
MIASTLLLMGLALLIVLALYIASQTGAKPNGNVLLGVSLPDHALQDKAVMALVAKYRRAYLLQTLSFLLLTLPMVFLAESASFVTVYFSLLLFALLCVHFKLLHSYFTRLSALKLENDWQVGDIGIISIDTEVSRRKHTFMVSQAWFLFPLAILLVPLVRNFFEPQAVFPWFSFLMGLIVPAFLYLIYLAIGKMRTKMYSADTEINLQLNYTFKRQWSTNMILLAVLSSLFSLVSLYASEVESSAVIYGGTLLYTLAMFVITILSHKRIQSERNRLLRGEKEDMKKDDDRYWIGGILYNNPNDRSLFVEKRVGIGMTMNLGTWGGKLIAGGVILLLVGTIGFTLWATLGS